MSRVFLLFCFLCIFSLKSIACEEDLGRSGISDPGFQEEIWIQRALGNLEQAQYLEDQLIQRIYSDKIVSFSRKVDGGVGASSTGQGKFLISFSSGFSGLFKSDPKEAAAEVSAYNLSKLLRFKGFEVPITVPFYFQGMKGALQLYISEAHVLQQELKDKLLKYRELKGLIELRDVSGAVYDPEEIFPFWGGMAVYDYIIGNGDRHEENLLIYKNERLPMKELLVGIDHGFAVKGDGLGHWRLRPFPKIDDLVKPSVRTILESIKEINLIDALEPLLRQNAKIKNAILSRYKQLLQEAAHFSSYLSGGVKQSYSPKDLDKNLSDRLTFGENSILIDNQKNKFFCIRDVDLQTKKEISFYVASGSRGGTVLVRENSRRGKIIATIRIYNTGSWEHWRAFKAPLRPSLDSGDLYFELWDRFEENVPGRNPSLFDLQRIDIQ